ncbi:tyrosine-type recombinase/integrase [Pararhodobacter zhoushanensis]|uniref:Tyrosine-type recombinase/integrase n=1 Tax=Pararhodobacter zhoushanensis TaxID=2479545 RepID=A0ABT3H5G1_9RHOB|nr:tyrosine-type recombinase/integrase [Pararhodobacter zhoushanensis]MCW1935029.1 tyrosine-type recombinase/integrase [Pararhodobacter zhoushanensis]
MSPSRPSSRSHATKSKAITLPLPSYAQLSDADEAALSELFRKGTPANTLRAWERDLAYIAAWKMAVFGRPLTWPEEEAVALRFILQHAQDLTESPGPAQDAALELIAIGLRRELTAPAPATLDRRIASWQAFHRMRNLPSPFSAPLVSQARQKARRANARRRVAKSARPITRDVLTTLLATCDDSHRGIRDRAMLTLAFASGGRRRSEVTALNVEDITLSDFAEKGLVWLRLLETKTTRPGDAPRLPLKGPAARALVHWLEVTALKKGPLFRPVSKSDRPLPRRLAPDALRVILRHRLALAGLPQDYASPHGLRAGFLTQAALDGAPLAAAMKLSLHKSAIQAQKYYADVEITDNPATDLLGS